MNLKNNPFEKRNNFTRIPYDEQWATHKVGLEIVNLLPSAPSLRPIVIVCIGTDRSTGDSLGPLIGTLLSEKPLSSFFVYGTLEDPIHAVNLQERMQEIKEKHYNPYIIGVDACLGRLKSVGIIQIGDGPVKPGAGVNKDLPAIGDMHITGIVNVSGFMEFFVLQNTRLNLVLKMAKIISNGLYSASINYSPKSNWRHLETNKHEPSTVNLQK